ncbi:MAG: tetratricopeptide repeat protein [Terracidiphilus sp.]
MHISVTARKGLFATAVLSFVLLSSAPRAHAVSKEIIALQTQVQQLLDQVQRLQSTLDAKMGVLQNLAQQTTDEANQMTAAVNAIQKSLNAQSEATTGKLDSISGQVQSLNDSVDELKVRVSKLDKKLQDLQSQVQAMQAPPAQAQPGVTQPGTAQPGTEAMPGMAPGAGATPGVPVAPTAPAVQQAPPLKETLEAAERDYVAGKYSVAQGEFQDVVHYYPLDNQSGTALFYLGEIAYQQKDYTTAIADYNQVIEEFGGNPKAPAAQLHKAYALLVKNKRAEAIHELRSLIQRYPRTPEARAARTKLDRMGVPVTAHAAR